MRKNVAQGRRGGHTRDFGDASLYDRDGLRKYLNANEIARFLAAIAQLPPADRLYLLTLACTGARISESLAITPASFQLEASVLSLATLKRRRPHMREVPLPPALTSALDQHYRLRERQRDPAEACLPLWPMSRWTAWRRVKRAMTLAGLTGRLASPKGLRHAFGVATNQAGIPLTLVQRWLGHARLATTAIYLDVSGPEERRFAERYWEFLARTGGMNDRGSGATGRRASMQVPGGRVSTDACPVPRDTRSAAPAADAPEAAWPMANS
jgi:integrase